VIDRVITNENRGNQQIKQYSPLVETYIQNLKPDKELGYTPAGDKYFLGRADFSKGVALVSLRTPTAGKKIFGSIGNFFSFATAIPARRLPANDLHRHERLRQAALQVRLRAPGISRRSALPGVRRDAADKSGKGRFLGRIWVEDQDFNIVRLTARTAAAGTPAGIFTSTAGAPTCSPGFGCRRLCTAKSGICITHWPRNWDFKAQTRLWGYNLGHASQSRN